MKVLMITGDKRFGPGHERYELQGAAVERLDMVCWPRGDSLVKIFNMARRGRYDVITAQDPFWRAHLARHLVQLFGGKINVQVHADLSAEPFHRRLMALYHLRRAHSVRAVSEKIKQQVLRLAPRARVSVLPVYIDIERFKNIERRPEAGLVLWLGRFEYEKDPLFALEVIQKVPGARLAMLGGGSLEPALRACITRLSLEKKVELAGWQNPVPLLSRASTVLCTSRRESWGASIIEALAAGVPVVAPDVGVAREAGAIVVPREQLAQKVAEVLQKGAKGELKLELLSREGWQSAWRQSLI